MDINSTFASWLMIMKLCMQNKLDVENFRWSFETLILILVLLSHMKEVVLGRPAFGVIRIPLSEKRSWRKKTHKVIIKNGRNPWNHRNGPDKPRNIIAWWATWSSQVHDFEHWLLISCPFLIYVWNICEFSFFNFASFTTYCQVF